jgi:hypothetical protein
MKAIKYNIEVYEGYLAFSHEFGIVIPEIYVPEKKLVFNVANDTLNAFYSDKESGRLDKITDKVDIEVRDDFIKVLEDFINTKEQFLELTRKLYFESDKI